MKFSVILILISIFSPFLLGMVKEETVATPLQTVLRFAAQRDVEIKPGKTTYLKCLPTEIKDVIKKSIIDANSDRFNVSPPSNK